MTAKPNWIDLVVQFVAPTSALRRMQARSALAMLGGVGSYHGADARRRAIRNWTPRTTSADSAVLPDLPTLRANSHDLVRNNPLAGGALATVTTSTVGTGLSVQPAILWRRLGLTEEASQAWQQTAKEYFELWAGRPEWCDQCGQSNFYALQELAFRSALEAGDTFALLPMKRFRDEPFETKVQLIEAERVCNANHAVDVSDAWAGGIKVVDGRPVMAAIAEHHPGSVLIGGNTWREVPFFGENSGRRNLIHLMTRLRPGQRRGVPYLAPIMEPLKQLGTYTDAEIMAAVVSAAFTVFVKKPMPEELPIPSSTQGAVPVPAGTSTDNEVGLGNGAIIDLGEGEEVSFADPSRPNTAFDPFVQAVLAQIGVALELPYEVLIKRFTASYSAARAALLEAWRFFRKRREWLAAQFCQPIYEALITEAVLQGRLRAPGFTRDPMVRAAYLRAVWIGDAPGAINPMDEAQAAEKRLEIGISDKAAETIAFSGRNWEDVHAQRMRERRAEQRDGLLRDPVQTPARPAPGTPRPAPVDEPEEPDRS